MVRHFGESLRLCCSIYFIIFCYTSRVHLLTTKLLIMTTSNNQTSSFGDEIPLLNIFDVDPKDFDIDIEATTEHDTGDVMLAFAPITYKGLKAFYLQSPESRSPFGISQDRKKVDKHTLTQNIETNNLAHKKMYELFLAKHNAIDAHLTTVMEAKCEHKGWWDEKKSLSDLQKDLTPSIHPAGKSKRNKRPYGPSIKYAIAKDMETKVPKFDAFVLNPNTKEYDTFIGNPCRSPGCKEVAYYAMPLDPMNFGGKNATQLAPNSTHCAAHKTQDMIYVHLNLSSVPPNSVVSCFYGFPQAWKSNDKSWGIRWKLAQVYRLGVTSSGFRTPGRQLMRKPQFSMNIENDFGGNDDDNSQPMDEDFKGDVNAPQGDDFRDFS